MIDDDTNYNDWGNRFIISARQLIARYSITPSYLRTLQIRYPNSAIVGFKIGNLRKYFRADVDRFFIDLAKESVGV